MVIINRERIGLWMEEILGIISDQEYREEVTIGFDVWGFFWGFQCWSKVLMEWDLYEHMKREHGRRNEKRIEDVGIEIVGEINWITRVRWTWRGNAKYKCGQCGK